MSELFDQKTLYFATVEEAQHWLSENGFKAIDNDFFLEEEIEVALETHQLQDGLPVTRIEKTTWKASVTWGVYLDGANFCVRIVAV